MYVIKNELDQKKNLPKKYRFSSQKILIRIWPKKSGIQLDPDSDP